MRRRARRRCFGAVHNGRDARCPSEEDREFVTGVWPPEFERILNGESASMLAQDAQLGKL